MLERDREYSIKEEVSRISASVDFCYSNNPASAGRFLAPSFKIKGEKDSTTIKYNIDKLTSLQHRLTEVQKELEDHDVGLFKTGGLQVRRGMNTKHNFNQEQLGRVRNLKTGVTAALTKLEEALGRVKKIYTSERKTRKTRKDKQQRLKRKNRLQRRKEAVMRELLAAIAHNKEPGELITEDDIDIEAVKSLNFRKAPWILQLYDNASLTPCALDKLEQNLNETCRIKLETLRQKHTEQQHASCRGYCEAEDKCPMNWECARLLERLGGTPYKHMFAPWQTGLPQLTLPEMEKDALELCSTGNILQLLDEHECFGPEASKAVRTRIAKLKGRNDNELYCNSSLTLVKSPVFDN